MRASQHDLVGAVFQHHRDGVADGLLGFGRRFAVALDQFDETAAGGGDEFDAAAVFGRRAAEKFAVETPLGGQHPDHPAAGIQAGGFHGRLHAHDRHRGVFLPQEVDCGGRGGIAGHDDHLAPLRDEAGDGLVGEPPHLLAGARSVGAVFAVAQIDERFGGQHAPHLAPDGQSAQPRIVNTYGSIVHSLLCICHSVRFGESNRRGGRLFVLHRVSKDRFDHLVVGQLAAIDDQLRLRVKRFARSHVAAHELDQFGVAQPPQAGTLLPSVRA